MDILMEHWLSIGTGVFLLSMVLYGHYRGFLRLAVSMSALVLSLVIVNIAMPYVNGFLKENTEIHQSIGKGLLKMAGSALITEDGVDPVVISEESEAAMEYEGIQIPAKQRELIEQLNIPEQMKSVLLENNNREIYDLLGVDVFLDYVGTYLGGMVFNLIGSTILYVLVYIGIRFDIKWMDLIARLPILHGINQIAGAVLGGLQGLLLVWFLCLVIRICAEMTWTQTFLAQIRSSFWLGFLYENNVFNWIFIRILNAFV